MLAVDDLLDENGVLHGAPGYSNADVLSGDRIIAIDGKPAERVPVTLCRSMIIYHQHFPHSVSYCCFRVLLLIGE